MTTEVPSKLDQLLAASLSEGLCRLGLPLVASTALEIADLPLPSAGGHADRPLLRALAPLYLASELESVGLLPAAEELAALWASGALPLTEPEIGAPIASFWRSRHERFSESERQALFARAFGAGVGPVLAEKSPANQDFLLRMLDLAEALTDPSDRTGNGGPAVEVGVRLRARLLVENLVRHGNGFVLYAAGDILAAVRTAIDILKSLAASHLWGSRDIWGLVRAYHQRRPGAMVPLDGHVRRGQAGMTLIGWLGDVLPTLGALSQPLVPPPSQVAAAAAVWIQTSLLIEGEGRRALERAA